MEVFHTTRERLHFLRALLRCDLLFFGGGSIIKELYANVGRSRYATLLMVLLTVTFTRWFARKRIVMSNIGVGPLQTPWGNRLARWILLQVDLLSVRDMKSYETCLRLGIPTNQVRLVPDAVFVTLPCELAKPEKKLPTPTDKLQVALNLNYNIENPANWPVFMDNLAAGLRLLHQQQPLVIHALPMQSQFNPENDWKMLATFQERIPEIEFHLHQPATFQEAAAVIANCDLVMAERLHALVMAAILGKPFLALVYDVKVRELVAGLDMAAFAMDVNHPFAPTLLADRVETLRQEAVAVHHHLCRRSQALRNELEEYFRVLRQCLALGREASW